MIEDQNIVGFREITCEIMFKKFQWAQYDKFDNTIILVLRRVDFEKRACVNKTR
jgi:hypothetical protein